MRTFEPIFVLTSACPRCGDELVIRYTRQDHRGFVGCGGYPACRFTCEYDQALQALTARIQALEGEVRTLRLGVRAPVNLERTLTRLIVLAHPDHWHQGQPATQLAHEVTTALIDLRMQLQGG